MNKTTNRGPYPLEITKNNDHFVIITNQGNHYAKTFDPSAARLIASAPDLLDALKALMVTEDMLRNPKCKVMQSARQAITKAEGKA